MSKIDPGMIDVEPVSFDPGKTTYKVGGMLVTFNKVTNEFRTEDNKPAPRVCVLAIREHIAKLYVQGDY